MASEGFTARVWRRNAGLIESIHGLPFNRELAEGTLDGERFRHYVVQDSLYLRRYGKALALCAARAPEQGATDFFARSAHGAIEVERSMHAGFLERLGLPKDTLEGAEPSLACQAYTDFLLAACYEQPYCVAVAAILPCFWIYGEVGTAIAARAGADNPYRAWIDTYADESFAAAVEEAKRLTDAAAEAAGEGDRVRMEAAFHRSTWYEWLFWDSAYHRRMWPAQS